MVRKLMDTKWKWIGNGNGNRNRNVLCVEGYKSEHLTYLVDNKINKKQSEVIKAINLYR